MSKNKKMKKKTEIFFLSILPKIGVKTKTPEFILLKLSNI